MLKRSRYYHLRWLPKTFADEFARRLNDPDVHVVDRCDAALNLGKRGGKDALPALIGAAADDDFWIRVDVVKSLALLADPRCLPFLLDMLEDPESLVRYEARLALSHIFSRLSAKKIYDLLKQQEEGSARGCGAFHATAEARDIAMNVFNHRILMGRGLDIVLDLGDREVRLHEGAWKYESGTPHGVTFVSRDRETGIEFVMSIECAPEDFVLRCDAVFPKDTVIENSRCDVFLPYEPDGPVLLATNGLENAPVRKFLLGNGLLMRKYGEHDGPYGITLDATQSPFFREIHIGLESDGWPIHLKPKNDRHEIPAGRVRLLESRIRPHPNEDDFEDYRRELLSGFAVGRGALRAEAVGGALRAVYGKKSVLSSYGFFVNAIAGGVHHATFSHQVPIEKRSPFALAASIREPAIGLDATLEISVDESGRLVVRLEKCELSRPCDEIRIGLLIAKTYSWWTRNGAWQTFRPPAPDAVGWEISHEDRIGASAELDLKPVNDPDLPILRVTLRAPDCPEARLVLLTTDESFAARSVEMRLPAGPKKSLGQPAIILEALVT